MDGCVCCMQKTGALLDMETTEVVMDTDKINYATFYHFCLGYEVPHVDVKPPKICVRCSVKLEDAYTFIKNSMKIYEILMSQQTDSKAGIELLPDTGQTLTKTTTPDPKIDQGGDWWPKPVKKEPEWLHTDGAVISISDDEEPTTEFDVVEQKYQPPHPENMPSSSSQSIQDTWFAISHPREVRDDARTTRSQLKVLPDQQPTMHLAIDPELLDEVDSDHDVPADADSVHDMGVCEPAEPEASVANTEPAVEEDDDDDEDEESEKEPEIYEFKCKLCPETFKTAKVLATHVKLHRDKTGAECLGCHTKFSIFYDVTVHMREKHRKKKKPQLRCLQCEMPPFISLLALKCHLLRKHYHRTSGLKFTDNFLCNDCGQKFMTSSSLYAHRKKTHTMLRVFQCTECPESFVRDYHRERHFQAMHSAEKNFKCAHCDEAYRTKPELERHVKEHFAPTVEGGGVLKRKRRSPDEGPVIHACEHCGKVFKYRSYLEVHLKRHTQPGFMPRASARIRCTKCPLVFSSEEAIEVHMKFHSEQTKSECIDCNIPFMSFNDLNIHLKFGHKPDSACPAPTLRCSQCVKPTFKHAVALKLHLVKRHLKKCTHTNDGTTCRECEMSNSSCLRCKLCASTFRNKQALRIHLKRHLTSKILRFRCSLCSKQCGNDAILKVHMQLHTENTRSGCIKCGLNFPSYIDLATHLKAQHEKELLTDLNCTQCEGSAFKNAFALRCHLHKMHLSTNAMARDMFEHKCGQCNKLFKTRGALNHHLTYVHATEKRFVCTLCNAKFKSGHSLKVHANAHQGEQKFKCSRCPATFRLSMQLTRHIKMHYLQRRAEREARPKGPKLRFRCKEPGCFKSYNFRSSLEVHGATHKTERDFVCSQCPASFKSKKYLNRHIQRHTLKNQFLKCDQCTVYCMNEQSLRTHVLLHGADTGGECIDCDEKFVSYNDLITHCKAHHKTVVGAPPAQPTVKCSHCDMPPFQNIFTLKVHILKQHLQAKYLASTNSQETQCEICKRQFMYRSELKSHMNTHLKEHKFKCKLCAASFKSNFSLGCHLKRHVEAKSLNNRCTLCQLYCGSEAALATHTKLHSERTGSECMDCSAKYPCYNDLMDHIKSNHGPESANPMPMLKCNRCPTPHFKNLFALKLHFLKKHTRTCPHSSDDLCAACEALERNFQCKLCLASFKSKPALDLHLKRHLNASTILKFRCSQCAKRCGNEATLKTHLVFHGEITSGDCLTCNVQFASYNDLLIHMKQNHPEESTTPPPSIKCRACDSVFKNMLGFKLHLMRIHLEASGITSSDHRCTEEGCSKLFTSAAGLRHHVAAVHANIRNFECHLCPMKFKQSGHLRVHLTTHSDARDFKCEQCPAAFKMQSALNKHLRQHLRPGFVPRASGSGSRSDIPMLVPRRPRAGRMRDENQNLECTTCGKEFQYPFQLKSHVLIHSDQRDFVCPMCSMAFKTNKHLAVHLKKHQKKSFMKYKCATCSSICKNQFTLRKHMRLHTDQSSAECMDCAEKFTNYFLLVDHMKEKHDANAETGANASPSVKCGSCEPDKGVYRTIETLRKHILAEH